jgi:Flp pilus assembly protein TadD
MEYIRRAVKLKPDDGYYVDSLGWAYYRLGNLAAAVEHLERAVELKPDDPIINDHLGDAYWKVGRKLEAKYQWQQSLTLKPEADLVVTIKKKIELGLQENDVETKSAQDRTRQAGQKTQ